MLQDREPKTIKSIAEGIDTDYKNTHTAVKNLVEKRALKERTVGNAKEISLTKSLTSEKARAEFSLRERSLEKTEIESVLEEAKKNFPASHFTLLLFGSYARNKETEGSDIDLICVIPDERFREAAENSLNTLPLPVHLLVFTEEEFVNMKDDPEPNVIKEAISNRIILHGIDSYYEMIQ